MIAILQKTLVAGAITLFFFGIGPCALVVWLIGRPARRRALLQDIPPQDSATSNELMRDESLNDPDRGNADRN